MMRWRWAWTLVLGAIAVAGSAFAQGPIFRELEDQFPPEAIEQLAFADFDGDGDADGFAFGGLGAYLIVNDGNARFAAQPTTSIGASGDPSLEPVNTITFAAADLNGDGLPDLVTSWGGLIPWAWMRVWINQGNGAFAQIAPFPLPSPPNLCNFAEPRAIVPGDVDGDGDLDLVVSVWCTPWGSNQLELFSNNGNGTFVNATNQLPSLTVLANQVFVRDLDHDGDLDIFISDNLFGPQTSCWPWNITGVQRVLWNNGSGSFSAPQTVPGPPAFNPRTALADLDGNGLPDLVYASTCPDMVSVSMNLGAGVFAPLASSQSPLVTNILACDLNGGGADEVVLLTAAGITVHTGGASGLSAPIQSLPYGAELGQVVDVEGDGDLDLVVTFHGRSALLLNAQGTLVPLARSLWGQVSDDQGMLGDVDGDGDPDYVAIASTGLASTLTVSLNDGSGTFVPAPSLCAGGVCPPMGGAPTPVCGFVLPKTVFPLDANGDGLLDLYTTDGPPFGVPCGAAPAQPDRLYLNTGGAWSLALSVPAAQTTRIEARDLNGDGRPDLVIGRGSGQNVVVFNLGLQGWSSPLVLPPHATLDLAVFDIDGDADLDILQAGSPLLLLLNDGSGGFVQAQVPTMGLPTGADTVVAGDLDGDGDQDVILSSVVWLKSGSTFVPSGPLPPAVGRPRLFDADADGDLDIGAAAGYPAPFNLVLMFNNGAGQFGAVQAISVGGEGGTFVAADVDRDADVDLIVPGPRLMTNVTRQIAKGSIVRPGHVATIQLYGPPGGVWALYASSGASALEVPPVGTVLLDLSNLQSVGAGTLLPYGGAAISALLPSSPALVGVTIYLQGLVGPPAHVTNLEVVTILGV